jgi:hypothetical protein
MDSKMKALSQLRKSFRSSRGEELPMKKVSVIAPTEEGLKEGLQKAEEILPKVSKMMPKIEDHEECEGCEMCKPSEESEESESSDEFENMSREDLIAMIKELKASKE